MACLGLGRPVRGLVARWVGVCSCSQAITPGSRDESSNGFVQQSEPLNRSFAAARHFNISTGRHASIRAKSWDKPTRVF